MSRYWSDLVRQLTPYVPGEQPRGDGLIKLNTNESPYQPSPAVLTAIAAVSGDSLRLYPDPESVALKQAFAWRNGLQPEQVFIGNGSDEVLAHTFQALLKHDKPVYFPDISYSFYPVWCELYGISHCDAPVVKDFSIDPAAYPADNGGIIIPNPNAPTGVLMELDAIRSLLRSSCDSVVVIAEAYIDFGGESAVRLIGEFDNLLVVQTLSKARALAGLRVGIAMGSVELIEGLERVKNSFNSYPLDVVAQRAALASLADEEYFQQSCQRVVASREFVCREMTALGFAVLPSAANFVFATHAQRLARDLFVDLRERGIIVRYFDKPRIDNYLRITIGTDVQCGALLSALRDLI
ncbi:MAG: histidinol-phosphate transaminase [Gammaproteobacteria bacterium]|nr:MAG: histidinol-phosphate transaminase [Gammaproteobacteria bacterium]